MKKNILPAMLAAAALGQLAVQAQSFNYASGDVLAAFRQSGSPDLIVDLGSIASFQNAGYNATFNLGADLSSTFGGVNGIYWSVFTYAASTTYAPVNTLWITDPRADVNTPDVAPTTGTASQQGYTAGEFQAVIDALNPNYGTVIDNQAIQLPASLGAASGGDPASYTTALGSGLDFNGTFGQNFENVSSNSVASVSDFFQQNPSARHSAGTGSDLGTFTLANGTLTFNAVPEPSAWAMIGTGLMSLVAFRRLARRG